MQQLIDGFPDEAVEERTLARTVGTAGSEGRIANESEGYDSESVGSDTTYRAVVAMVHGSLQYLDSVQEEKGGR